MASLKEDILAGMKGDASALERPTGKGKSKKSPAEMVAGLSPAQRKVLRARAEAIIEALDEVEAAETEPEAEETEEV
jgi:hypothetical protein